MCILSSNKLILSFLLILFHYVSFSQKETKELVLDFNNTTLDSDKKVKLLTVVDHFLYENKNTDSVVKYLNYSISVPDDSLFYADLLYRKSILNNKISKYDLSIINAEEASMLYIKYGENYKNAQTRTLLGNVYQSMYRNKLALSNYDQANPILKGKDRIKLLTGYAAVYNQLNDLSKSIDFYNQAYEMSIKYGVDTYLFNILNGMASVYFKNKNPKKSLESLEKALEVSKANNYYLGQVSSLHNIGYKYQIDENYVKAISYFEEAIKLIDKITNKIVEGQIYYKYADCLIALNQLNKATFYANKAEIIFSDLNKFGRLPYVLRTKSNLESKKGNYNESIRILEEAISIASKNQISSLTSDLYYNLAANYSKTGNAVKTFESYNKHIVIKDSLENVKNASDVEKVKTKFESSLRENKLKQDLSLLSEKNVSSYYRNILLALVVLTLLYFIYKQKKINKVKQKVLEQEKQIIAKNELLLKDKVKYKNSQITEYAILIDERNKFFDQFKEQISEIRELSNDVSQKKLINNLQFFIKDNISVKREKVELDKKKSKKSDNFIYNLEQNFPKLTDKELSICRFLILNLSSKQISEKMDITVQSVNNYRASIRKKANLEPGQNLKRFLKSM